MRVLAIVQTYHMVSAKNKMSVNAIPGNNFLVSGHISVYSCRSYAGLWVQTAVTGLCAHIAAPTMVPVWEKICACVTLAGVGEYAIPQRVKMLHFATVSSYIHLYDCFKVCVWGIMVAL